MLKGTMSDTNHPDRDPENEKEQFLFPHANYRGKVKPENLVFNANLQEFAQRVSYTCNLETAGKIGTEDAYKQIKSYWKALKQSRKELGIGDDPFASSDGGDGE